MNFCFFSFQSPFYELRDALQSNPYKFVDTDKDVLQTVNEKNGAVALIQEDDFIAFVAKEYCDLIYVKVGFLSYHSCKLFRVLFFLDKNVLCLKKAANL